ncbi:MAG: threonine synthase [Bacilli bacterium]|nr:threonine synthase [Bacilli bacterium]
MVKSTRSNLLTTETEAILRGLAPDGGLYVFDQINPKWFQKTLVGKSYSEIAFLTMKELLPEFSLEEIHDIVECSYNEANFQDRIVGLVPFQHKAYLTLYHGRTFAFKDLALSTLPNLMAVAKAKANIVKHTVILTATSGDTGSAALSGFSRADDTTVIVLYPNQGVSEFQELQMNQYKELGHHVLAVDGNFDDCQKLAKDLFQSLNPKHILLSSANSINIGRIIPQIIYYVYSYAELCDRGLIAYGEKINITVPTGNFGNIYSAYIAKQLGVPINRLIIASNKNNVLTDVFQTQQYNTNRTLHKTISPSMDILISSNLERYLYHLYGSKQVKTLMDTLKETKLIELEGLNPDGLFQAYYATEEETKETIKEVFHKDHYLIDPHTAVCACVAKKFQEETKDDHFMLLVSTANPYKFSSSMLEALELDSQETLENDMKKLQYYTNLKIDQRMLDLLESNPAKTTVTKQEAFDLVQKIVGEIDAQNHHAGNNQ